MGQKNAGGKGEDEAIENIESKRKELENSAFLAALNRALKPYEFREIRFLAVGNYGLEDGNAEYQTALALYLSDKYSGAKITAWDPNFKKKDLRILSNLGIRVSEADPRVIKSDLLWFVPHAPYFLEPSLLKRVQNCVYIGNDLSLSVANSMRNDKECAWYREAATITPLKVKPKDPWREAFKNTAIHEIPPKKEDKPTNKPTSNEESNNEESNNEETQQAEGPAAT